MEYIRKEAENQQIFQENSGEFLHLPSSLPGFINKETTKKKAVSGRTVFCFSGELSIEENDRLCRCGQRMHINGYRKISLRHLCFGGALSCVCFPHYQFVCPACGATKSQHIAFKADHHRITEDLYQYARDLLATGTYTNKQVCEITGLGKNTVKAIDLKRLQDLYTIDGTKLIQPTKTTRILGIDEFKLHNGWKYATHIVDLETGHIIWIANGRKKQVVYDFIDHVGLDWMSHVKAVSCDMNSDFEEAFLARCPHIQPVFDHFHIVKYFNEKVVSAVRKDEQRRLINEGDRKAADALKRTRHILMSKRSTLQRKDQEAAEGRIVRRGSSLFKIPDIARKGGAEAKYDRLLKENALFFALDLVKEQLEDAYRETDEALMAEKIAFIMDICDGTGNRHFRRFSLLLGQYIHGILAHATFQITNGKLEGINQKIKTIRRHGYGYPDDGYFFLKLFDASRTTYVRNPKSHKICD